MDVLRLFSGWNCLAKSIDVFLYRGLTAGAAPLPAFVDTLKGVHSGKERKHNTSLHHVMSFNKSNNNRMIWVIWSISCESRCLAISCVAALCNSSLSTYYWPVIIELLMNYHGSNKCWINDSISVPRWWSFLIVDSLEYQWKQEALIIHILTKVGGGGLVRKVQNFKINYEY